MGKEQVQVSIFEVGSYCLVRSCSKLLAVIVLSTIFLFFLSHAACVSAASFDCGKASSDVEKRICANDDLSRLDDEMGKAYAKVLKEDIADKQSMVNAQHDWLKERDRCAEDVCIERIYKVRLDILNAYLRNAGEPGKSDYAGLCLSLKKMSPKERRSFMEKSDFNPFWENPEQSDGRFGYKGRDYVLTYRDKSLEEVYSVAYVREADRKIYKLCYLGGDEVKLKEPSGEGSAAFSYGGKFYYKAYIGSFVKKPVDAGGVGHYYVMGRLRWMKPDAQGLDLCDRLAAAFNASPEAQPMVCEVKFPKSLTEAVVPKWEDVGGNTEALAEFKRLVTKEARNKNDVIENNLENMISDGKVTLWRSRFRLNTDDVEDVVYQLRRKKLAGECEYSDKEPMKTAGKPIFRYAAYDGLGGKTFYEFNGQIYGGVFLYKGNAYFYHWGYGESSHGWFKYKENYTEEPRIAISEGTNGAFGDSFGSIAVCDIGYRK